MNARLRIAVFALFAFCSTADAGFEAHVDWAWNDDGPPTSYVSQMDEIKPGVKRGSRSAHQCVEEAIKEAKGGDKGTALRWLMSTQSHNQGAREEVEKAGNAAVDYAVTKYGGGYPAVKKPKEPKWRLTFSDAQKDVKPSITVTVGDKSATEAIDKGANASAVALACVRAAGKIGVRAESGGVGIAVLYGTQKAVVKTVGCAVLKEEEEK